MNIFLTFFFSTLVLATEIPVEKDSQLDPPREPDCIIHYRQARIEASALGIPLSKEAKTNAPIETTFDHDRCVRLGILVTRSRVIIQQFHPQRITCFEMLPQARDEAFYWREEAIKRSVAGCSGK